MKNTIKILALFTIVLLQTACKSVDISPKVGVIKVAPKSEIRMWQNTNHPSFSIYLENQSTKNSCEAYKVTANGNEKWISPSLLASKTLDFSIPSDGSLLIKNFSEEEISINYSIN